MKKFNGTWFEFHHHNTPEGVYWNPACADFTDEQWKIKVSEIASLGMKYIVLMCTALYDKAFFKTDIYDRFALKASDPIGALLTQADAEGIKVFMSAGFYGDWTHTTENMTSPEVTKRAFKAMEQLFALYGSHESFYGWYLPDEAWIGGTFDEDFIKYINLYTSYARTLNKGFKNLIAPYGTKDTTPNDRYVSQLERIDIDFVAYQDEVGVQKSTPAQTPAFYEKLRIAHDKAGRSKLWADMEIFEFEGAVYSSALIPAPIERIKQQLVAISDYVDEILVYQYLGIMNKPGTAAFCGHPASEQYYSDYASFIKTF
ncbi:MAG TPA: DUF4434 domain-containing protein [Bacillota bacterium]|nr:DUF4434 domain-containing protein [Bacillota bacterium]